jgi:hypothetical protein
MRLNFTLYLMRAITFVTFLLKSGTVSCRLHVVIFLCNRSEDEAPGGLSPLRLSSGTFREGPMDDWVADQALFPASEASGTNHRPYLTANVTS